MELSSQGSSIRCRDLGLRGKEVLVVCFVVARTAEGDPNIVTLLLDRGPWFKYAKM